MDDKQDFKKYQEYLKTRIKDSEDLKYMSQYHIKPQIAELLKKIKLDDKTARDLENTDLTKLEESELEELAEAVTNEILEKPSNLSRLASKLYMKYRGPIKVEMSSVIIEEHKIEQVKEAISQLEHHSVIFEEWGFEEIFEKGTAVSMLFWGIPGTGKTLMAQAIADFLNFELKVIGTAELETSEPGGTERNMKRIFGEANRRAEAYKKLKAQGETVDSETKDEDGNPTQPQILLFDECDSLLTDRANLGSIMAAQVNTLLGEIEKFTGVVIFTTNRLEKLDPALERRISAKIEFEFPDFNARKLIWRRMIPSRAPIAKDVDLEKLAKYPMVGGNIKNAVLNAARKAAHKSKTEIDLECFEVAIKAEVKALAEFIKSHGLYSGVKMREDFEMLGGVIRKPDIKKDKKIDLDKQKARIKKNEEVRAEANRLNKVSQDIDKVFNDLDSKLNKEE